MKRIQQVFDFYINSSMHVALAVFSMSWVTLIEFDLPYDENVLYFIFFATITGYNFVKFFGIAIFHHRSLAKWLQLIQLFSLLCFILMCYFAFQLQQKVIFYVAAFGVVTFLYAIPFLPKHLFIDQQRNLRNIGGLKVYVIALVWAGVTACLPLLNNDYHFDTDVWITTLQRFLLVVVLMLPFEIRDLQYDSVKLSTIPQTIGVKLAKIIGVLLGILFFSLELLKDNMDQKQLLIYLLITIIALLFLVFAKKNQNNYYSSFWVESVPIIWLLLNAIF